MERTQELSLRIGGTNYILSNSYAASFWFKVGCKCISKDFRYVDVDMLINKCLHSSSKICKYVKQIVQ